MIGPYLYRDRSGRRKQLQHLIKDGCDLSVATVNPTIWGNYAQHRRFGEWPTLHAVTYFTVFAKDLLAAKQLTDLCGTGDFDEH